MGRRANGRVLAALAALALLGAGCTAGSEQAAFTSSPSTTPPAPSSEASASADPDRQLVFAVVTNGAPTDPFWEVVKSGAEDAGAVNDAQIDYQSDPDPSAQARLVDAAVSAAVDGLIVSMPDPDTLSEPMMRAGEAGIPVITINEGAERSAEFGALTHVGQSDLDAGRGAGQRLRDAGVTTLLCVIQESGDQTLEQRCQGAAEGFGGTDTSVINLPVNGGNLSAAETTIVSELTAEPRIDGVLTLSAAVASAAAAALENTGSAAALATFESGTDVQQAIRDGQILFAVDQQEYLQGYLPVVFLGLFVRTGTIAGAGQPVPTGPRYVTRDNVDTVMDLSMTGTR